MQRNTTTKMGAVIQAGFVNERTKVPFISPGDQLGQDWQVDRGPPTLTDSEAIGVEREREGGKKRITPNERTPGSVVLATNGAFLGGRENRWQRVNDV